MHSDTFNPQNDMEKNRTQIPRRSWIFTDRYCHHVKTCEHLIHLYNRVRAFCLPGKDFLPIQVGAYVREPFVKMEPRPPFEKNFTIHEETIFGVSSIIYEQPYIKIASYGGGRGISDNNNCRNHFHRTRFSFGSFSFVRAKENEQLPSDVCSASIDPVPSFEERSFLCFDTKERTKGKIKAGGKTAKNFFAELKQIKYVIFLKSTGHDYLFSDAPLRNFLNAVFPQAVFPSCSLTLCTGMPSGCGHAALCTSVC